MRVQVHVRRAVQRTFLDRRESAVSGQLFLSVSLSALDLVVVGCTPDDSHPRRWQRGMSCSCALRQAVVAAVAATAVLLCRRRRPMQGPAAFAVAARRADGSTPATRVVLRWNGSEALSSRLGVLQFWRCSFRSLGRL